MSSFTRKLASAGMGLALCAMGAGAARASSHREAPAIAQDPYADNTDVYTFISPADANRIVFVANYNPLLRPASGPNFYGFADSVRYEIHIDNDGDAVADITYRYEFVTHVKNGNTFLHNTGTVASLTDPNLNVTQTYTLSRVNEDGTLSVIGTHIPVAPWYVGSRSFPGSSYDTVAGSAVKSFGAVKTFAGPRDEPFFVDLHVFDLLGVAGDNSTYGANVMSIVLEVPITDVASGGVRPTTGTEKKSVIGVYASALRRQITILRRNRGQELYGGWIQVSRLGWPLVNELVVPLKDKDKYNRTDPVDDVANLGAYLLMPELPGLLDAVLGAGCTAAPPRSDIVGLLSPNGTTPADLLRIRIDAGQTYADSAFPNGRKLADDVTDTELTVFCGKPLADGVGPKTYQDVFPYLSSPTSGNPAP